MLLPPEPAELKFVSDSDSTRISGSCFRQPGQSFNMTYNFQAVPMAGSYASLRALHRQQRQHRLPRRSFSSHSDEPMVGSRQLHALDCRSVFCRGWKLPGPGRHLQHFVRSQTNADRRLWRYRAVQRSTIFGGSSHSRGGRTQSVANRHFGLHSAELRIRILFDESGSTRRGLLNFLQLRRCCLMRRRPSM